MSDDLDIIEWEELPPSGQERVIRMLPQLAARIGKWGRMPADISPAMIRAAALLKGVPLDVATRKRDGVTRVWARIRETDQP